MRPLGMTRVLCCALALGFVANAAPAAAQTVVLRRMTPADADSIRVEMLRADVTGLDSALDEFRAAMPAGWIGILSQGPSRQQLGDDGLHVTYFGYPTILSVDPRSPAERAGVAPGDVLVAYNGIDVVGREFNLTKLLVPDTRLQITIDRDGDRKSYTIDVAAAPEGVFRRRVELERGPMFGAGVRLPRRPALPLRVPRSLASAAPLMLSPRGAFGASLSPVGPALAKALKLEQGLLVNDVADDSPAADAGLHPGDVILSAGAQPVETLDDLQSLLVAHLGDRSLLLQIVRDHKAKRVTVTW